MERVTRRYFLPAALFAVALVCGGCGDGDKTVGFQGYMDADFVRIAAPKGGLLRTLAVKKGDRVEKGKVLFAVDANDPQGQADCVAGLRRALKSYLMDMGKCERPDEIDVQQGLLGAALAMKEGSGIGEERQTMMWGEKATSEKDYLMTKHIHMAFAALAAAAKASVRVAELASRPDRIDAVRAAETALEDLEKMLRRQVEQQSGVAPADAVVHDTLYRVGEFVPSGSPVAVLLPPENLKAKFYISSENLGRLAVGDKVSVKTMNGDVRDAVIDYISAAPEYTPPYIYSDQTAATFVYEAKAALVSADNLRGFSPGLPVTIVPSGSAARP